MVPIDYIILDGFSQRFSQVFKTSFCGFSNTADRLKAFNKNMGGEKVSYPYAMFQINSAMITTDYYNTNSLGRVGILANRNNSNNAITRYSVLPVSYTINIVFVTNAMKGEGGMLDFIANWMMARRFGYLKYNVVYDNITYSIYNEMSEDVSIPNREAVTDQESKYETETSLTLKGYISNRIEKTAPLTNDFTITTAVENGNEGEIIASRYFKFTQK